MVRTRLLTRQHLGSTHDCCFSIGSVAIIITVGQFYCCNIRRAITIWCLQEWFLPRTSWFMSLHITFTRGVPHAIRLELHISDSVDSVRELAISNVRNYHHYCLSILIWRLLQVKLAEIGGKSGKSAAEWKCRVKHPVLGYFVMMTVHRKCVVRFISLVLMSPTYNLYFHSLCTYLLEMLKLFSIFSGGD